MLLSIDSTVLRKPPHGHMKQHMHNNEEMVFDYTEVLVLPSVIHYEKVL